MTFREKLADKLGRLKEYKGYLEGCQIHTLADLKRDPLLRGAVERYLHLSVESVIDVAEMLIAEFELRKPEEYREAIEILGEASVLPIEFASRFAPIAGFRNILVHEYARIDLEQVHAHLMKDLDDFDQFAYYVVQFLNQSGQ